MREDFTRKDLSSSDEIMIREYYLGKGVDTSNLFIVKNFIRFLVIVSCGKIVALSTVDFINIYIEWFFVGFIRIIGTPIFDEDRSEVYNISY